MKRAINDDDDKENEGVRKRITVQRFGCLTCLPSSNGDIYVFVAGFKQGFYDSLGLFCPMTDEFYEGE